MGFLFENSKMPEREIIKRAHRIKPVYYDARVGSLMFTPTADISMSKEDLSAGCVVSALELKPLAEYSFAHHQDFTALSTPSVKDVLSSLPDDIIHSACAVNCEYLEYDTVQLRHMFKVTVYQGELPKKIAEQPVVLNGCYHFSTPDKIHEARIRKPSIHNHKGLTR